MFDETEAFVDEPARRNFEAIRRRGRLDPIDQFLPAKEDSTYWGTLVELILIDMEFSWKTGFVENCPDKPSVDSIDESAVTLVTPRPPRLEDYLARFPDLCRDGRVPLELIEEEYRVRRVWGDFPLADEYLERFPPWGTQLLDSLHGIDEDISETAPLVTVKVYRDRKLVYTTGLSSSLEIGRQERGEAGSHCRAAGAALTPRLIIADLGEKSISRHHARLELRARNMVRLTNLSSVRSVTLGGGARLPPNERQDLVLPATLIVGDRVILLELPER